MAKELLLYSGIYSWTAEMFINSLEENLNEEVIMRVNSGGGECAAAWGMFAKMTEHGNVTVKVDGMAASSACNMLLYAKRVEALDVSDFILHRAAAWNEENNPEVKAWVAKCNADLRTKLEAKVSGEKFREVTGHSLDELFNPEARLNIFLTAKQMMKLGIVQKVNKLKPTEQKQMAEAMAHWSLTKIAASVEDSSEDNVPKPTLTNKNTMTLEKLKAEHPVLYSQIIAEGETAGVKKEQERVGAWMAYVSVDAKRVVEGITNGEPVNTKVMAEMSVIMASADYLVKLEKSAAKEITTTPSATTVTAAQDAKTKEAESFLAGIDDILGLKKKEKPAAV